MNKLDYKHNLGDLVKTKQFEWEIPVYGIVVKRLTKGRTSKLYKVHWSDTGLDNRWIHESSLEKVRKVDNEV